MLRFWECYVEGTGGGQHYKHWTEWEAENEAERLAGLPGIQGKKVVYLFECIGKCYVEPSVIRWEVAR